MGKRESGDFDRNSGGTVLNHIEELNGLDAMLLIGMELDQITDDVVDRWSNRIANLKVEKPEDEKALGRVTNPLARKLWVLRVVLNGKMNMAHARMKSEPLSISEEEELHTEIHKWDALKDIIDAMFWHQVYVEVGYWGHDSVGIRDNWEVVRFKSKPQIPEIFRGMFGTPED